MRAVRNGQLLTFRCPGTSSNSSPAVCWIRFSIASLWYRLLLGHGWHRKQKSVTVQCKAQWYYKSPSRRVKNEGENFFHTPLYTAFSSGRTTPKYLTPVLLYLQAWLGFCGDYPAIRLRKLSLAIPKQRALLCSLIYVHTNIQMQCTYTAQLVASH